MTLEADRRVTTADGRRSEQTRVAADDGVSLTVETWPADRPDAPTILALHGIGANRYGFLPLVDAFAGEVTVVAPDARGRGLSDKPEERAAYGHRRHAEDAACVLRQLGLTDVVVVGQSMGAWVGLLLAARHPELVKALVLGDGGYFADLPDGMTPQQKVDSVMGAGWSDRLRMTLPSMEVTLQLFQTMPPYNAMWDDNVVALLTEGLEELPDGSVRTRNSVTAIEVDQLDYFTPGESDKPYCREALAKVQCPVHLVRATRGFDTAPDLVEPLIPDDALVGFQREVPQLTVETVPDTNHYTLNFGDQGVSTIANAVRAALANEQA